MRAITSKLRWAQRKATGVKLKVRYEKEKKEKLKWKREWMKK